jgi:glyoxylase-like metal-dependent hydrolase (beta-lactamase superfamily II)
MSTIQTNTQSLSNSSSRRVFIRASLGAGAVILGPRRQFASETGIVPTMIEAASQAKIEVHELRRNIAVLEGSGGNIAVLTGKEGKLLVDAGFTVSRPRIMEALDSLGEGPVTQLLNTHWHVDHTDGNGWLHAAGAAITAHENTRSHLSKSTRVDEWNYTFPPAPAAALPTAIFAYEHRLSHNDTGVASQYYGPAHTDGDISVVFEEADVIHVGDTWWNGFYPFIDYSTGGSIDGMIRATERNLSAVTAKTIIIPGHGPVGNKAALSGYYDMLVAIRNNVSKLKTQGRSLAETIAAKPTEDFDARWGQFLMTPAIFTRLVYSGV